MDRGATKRGGGPCGAAFLLAQLGAHAAGRFGERLATINLSPPDAGLLRKIGSDPGISQQALAEHLGVLPSRMVALVDRLEEKRLVQRVNSPDDRRTYALHLTAHGQRVLGDVAQIAIEHGEELCSALNEAERAKLVELCARIVRQQGLTPGVHPGYRQLGGKPER
jgi:DNA-binding MarR family transcriptional regulator